MKFHHFRITLIYPVFTFFDLFFYFCLFCFDSFQERMRKCVLE